MDFTPGIFDMSFNRLGDKSNRPQTTRAKQLASYVVLYSPIQMTADLPKNYQANLAAFQFIKTFPLTCMKVRRLPVRLVNMLLLLVKKEMGRLACWRINREQTSYR
jgi:hypothetical protein